MGNSHVKPHPRPRNRKQVHWKAADRPSPPGKPHLSSENDLTPDLVTITWAKPTRDGGSPVTGYMVEHRRTGTPHWIRANQLLVPFPELTISDLEPGWRYQFRVRAENAVGLSDPSEISEPLTVTLQKFAVTAPKFLEELKDTTVLENDKVEFIVNFLGQPTPKICWYKDGFEIFSSRRTRIFTENDRSILTIHQSALTDEGEIKCTATNKAGHASTKARLTLEAPPSIRLPRQYEDGLLFEIGEMIRLKVSVAGRPTPLVFWTHNGESIQNNDRYEVEYVDKSSILKLGEARRSDRGEYQIKAVNKIGEDVVSFLVTITDKPSPPGKARVVMTLGRSVTLSWSTPEDDGGCKIGNYIVEYYRLGWNVWLKAATSRQLTTILGDLIEGSEYKFRVKAESPYGVSDPSEESDVVFIPDPKRGITSPQARSRSQPKDIINEIAAPVVATRRKSKPRSQSITPRAEVITDFDSDVPKRPERTKIKSPPKTPDLSPKSARKELNSIQQTIIDKASIARDLSYGSPEIKVKKEVVSLQPNYPQNKSNGSEKSLSVSPELAAKSKSPSPLEKRRTSLPQSKSNTPSPTNQKKHEEKKIPSPEAKRSLTRQKSETLEESSEFMLVLYPDANERGHRKDAEFDFDDYDVPPPISLSAPELGVEPPVFENLKPSASSTELLHERAMMRFNEAVAAEEEMKEMEKRRKFSYDGQHNIEIPKIQINSKDEQDIVGLERKHSRRRLSAGNVVQQRVLWAQRRFSLRNSSDLSELVETKRQKSPKPISNFAKPQTITKQRSESEEKEEKEFEKIRAKMALQGQSSFEKRSIEVVDEDKWLEDYEESLSEEESESSEDERRFEEDVSRRVYSDEDEETYHPGVISNAKKSITEEPFEILTKRNKLPDPNFVPKPILKKSEILNKEVPMDIPKEVPKEIPNTKIRSHSPRPQFRQPQDVLPRERSQSLIHPPVIPPSLKSNTYPGSSRAYQRSLSLSATEEIEVKEEDLLSSVKVAPGHNISTVAQICGITAASIVIPDELLKRKKYEEEAKVVVDHYTDIVKSYGQRKRMSIPQILPEENWKTVVKEKEHQPKTVQEIKKEVLPKPVQEVKKEPPPKIIKEVKPEKPAVKEEPPKEIQIPQTTKQEIIPPTKNRSPSPSPQRRSPTPQRGRNIHHGPRKSSKRSKTPSKSPSRLENWAGYSQRKSSPSPMKQNIRRGSSPSPMKRNVRRASSPSPIPLAKPKPPMLREIMTQTSVGLELNYSSDSRTSTPGGKSRQEELCAKAEKQVRSFVDYTTDLAMFIVACWLYLFSNELLALPVLLIMVYRQLKDGIKKRIPKWIIKRFSKKKAKKQIN